MNKLHLAVSELPLNQSQVTIIERNKMLESRVSQTSRPGQAQPPLSKSTRSLNKSSVSIRGKSKKTEELEPELPEDVEAIRKQYAELKALELSEEAREALQKVQRFDRYIYSKETEKLCKEPLKNELVRLEKVKNNYKNMRGRFFDNELTITALFNHIKLISEMNREIGDLDQIKGDLKKEEDRRKKE